MCLSEPAPYWTALSLITISRPVFVCDESDTPMCPYEKKKSFSSARKATHHVLNPKAFSKEYKHWRQITKSHISLINSHLVDVRNSWCNRYPHWYIHVYVWNNNRSWKQRIVGVSQNRFDIILWVWHFKNWMICCTQKEMSKMLC